MERMRLTIRSFPKCIFLLPHLRKRISRNGKWFGGNCTRRVTCISALIQTHMRTQSEYAHGHIIPKRRASEKSIKCRVSCSKCHSRVSRWQNIYIRLLETHLPGVSLYGIWVFCSSLLCLSQSASVFSFTLRSGRDGRRKLTRRIVFGRSHSKSAWNYEWMRQCAQTIRKAVAPPEITF